MKERGFTLLEVLVALVILAISLTAFFKALSSQIENLNTLQQKTAAIQISHNVLKAVSIGVITPPQPPMAFHDTAEMLGKHYPYEISQINDTEHHIKKMTINVWDPKHQAILETYENIQK